MAWLYAHLSYPNINTICHVPASRGGGEGGGYLSRCLYLVEAHNVTPCRVQVALGGVSVQVLPGSGLPLPALLLREPPQAGRASRVVAESECTLFRVSVSGSSAATKFS